jgi:hypothetical protein
MKARVTAADLAATPLGMVILLGAVTQGGGRGGLGPCPGLAQVRSLLAEEVIAPLADAILEEVEWEGTA